MNWYFPKDAYQKSDGFSEVRLKKSTPSPWKRRKTTSSATFCATGAWGLRTKSKWSFYNLKLAFWNIIAKISGYWLRPLHRLSFYWFIRTVLTILIQKYTSTQELTFLNMTFTEKRHRFFIFFDTKFHKWQDFTRLKLKSRKIQSWF